MDKKVLAHDIKKGMFVTALDRPWTDTPFVLQGFLVEDDDDVARLEKYCRYVYIDLARSIGESFALENAIARKAASAEEPKAHVAVRQAWQQALDEDESPKSVKPAKSSKQQKPEKSAAEVLADVKRRGVRPVAARRREPSNLQWAAEISSEEHALLGAKTIDGRSFEAKAPASGNPPTSVRPADGRSWLRAVADNVADSVSAVGEWFKRPDIPKFEDLPPSGRKSELLERLRPRMIVYEETQSLAEELPRAQEVLDRSHAVLKEIVDDVQAKGAVHIEKADEVVSELVDSMARNPNALIWLSRLKDVDRRAYTHSMQAAIYMVALGLQLGLGRDELKHLSLAGLMLDVGKLRVPQELLEKPGKLSESEFAEVRRHVRHSVDILDESKGVHAKVREAVKRHHEREDGTGYPKGKKGEQIGLYGRMAGIVDTFVALTNPRPYAETLSMHDALRQLYKWRGAQFHEPLVEQFVQAVGVFPVGSMVELSSGEVAVVIAHNRVRRLKPRVLLLTGPDKSLLRRPVSIDLLYAPAGPDNQELTIAHALPAGAYGIDPREFYVQ